ncbi:Nitrilase family, member 2 [Seminavis robusta]|uniref:Nitrilase family, member 2 n=1 Tax=Seminavis robusta TaxID=568900 RepID=A0A9N8H9T1_9STRA|nr:Nitrilase family, member 2 [Seminavis robusta]|eukprot:Sro267_g103350.1 Nitrilase family, member 2 (280) ;mRNA; r:19074-19913
MLTIQNPNTRIHTFASGDINMNTPRTPFIMPSSEGRRLLKDGFQPSDNDCICARGNAVKSHPGNLRFLQLVDENLQKYAEASSKLEKSLIVSAIIEDIRMSSPEGGFVKCEKGRWYEVGDHHAREKVGQRLRDQLSSRYSSSSAAKKRRRRADEATMMNKLDDIVVGFEGQSLADRVQKLTDAAAVAQSGEDPDDEELQRIFNQANWELLQRIKDQNLCGDNDTNKESPNKNKQKNKRTMDDESVSSINSSSSRRSKRKLDDSDRLEPDGLHAINFTSV